MSPIRYTKQHSLITGVFFLFILLTISCKNAYPYPTDNPDSEA